MSTPTNMFLAQVVISVGIMEGSDFLSLPFMYVRRYFSNGTSDRILVNYTFGQVIPGSPPVFDNPISDVKIRLFESIDTSGFNVLCDVGGRTKEETLAKINAALEVVPANSKVVLLFPKREWDARPFYEVFGFDSESMSEKVPTTLEEQGLKVKNPFIEKSA